MIPISLAHSPVNHSPDENTDCDGCSGSPYCMTCVLAIRGLSLGGLDVIVVVRQLSISGVHSPCDCVRFVGAKPRD